jgi:hypothetical protein
MWNTKQIELENARNKECGEAHSNIKVNYNIYCAQLQSTYNKKISIMHRLTDAYNTKINEACNKYTQAYDKLYDEYNSQESNKQIILTNKTLTNITAIKNTYNNDLNLITTEYVNKINDLKWQS